MPPFQDPWDQFGTTTGPIIPIPGGEVEEDPERGVLGSLAHAAGAGAIQTATQTAGDVLGALTAEAPRDRWSSDDDAEWDQFGTTLHGVTESEAAKRVSTAVVKELPDDLETFKGWFDPDDAERHNTGLGPGGNWNEIWEKNFKGNKLIDIGVAPADRRSDPDAWLDEMVEQSRANWEKNFPDTPWTDGAAQKVRSNVKNAALAKNFLVAGEGWSRAYHDGFWQMPIENLESLVMEMHDQAETTGTLKRGVTGKINQRLQRGIESIVEAGEYHADVSFDAYRKQGDPERKHRRELIRSMESMRRGVDPAASDNMAFRGLLGAAEMAPAMFAGGAMGKLIGGSVAAAAGSSVGRSMGLTAALEDLSALVPGAMGRAGAGGVGVAGVAESLATTAGSLAGGTLFWGSIESVDIGESIRANGGSDELANTMAATGGLLIGAMEYAQWAMLGGLYKGGKEAMMPAKDAVRKTVTNYAKGLTGLYAAEVTTEMAQAVTALGARALAVEIGHLKGLKWPEEFEALAEELREVALAMVWIMGPGAVRKYQRHNVFNRELTERELAGKRKAQEIQELKDRAEKARLDGEQARRESSERGAAEETERAIQEEEARAREDEDMQLAIAADEQTRLLGMGYGMAAETAAAEKEAKRLEWNERKAELEREEQHQAMLERERQGREAEAKAVDKDVEIASGQVAEQVITGMQEDPDFHDAVTAFMEAEPSRKAAQAVVIPDNLKEQLGDTLLDSLRSREARQHFIDQFKRQRLVSEERPSPSLADVQDGDFIHFKNAKGDLETGQVLHRGPGRAWVVETTEDPSAIIMHKDIQIRRGRPGEAVAVPEVPRPVGVTAEMEMAEIEQLSTDELLRISPEATQDEVDSAYRKMALKYHPDSNPTNPERAKAIFSRAKDAWVAASFEAQLRAGVNAAELLSDKSLPGSVTGGQELNVLIRHLGIKKGVGTKKVAIRRRAILKKLAEREAERVVPEVVEEIAPPIPEVVEPTEVAPTVEQLQKRGVPGPIAEQIVAEQAVPEAEAVEVEAPPTEAVPEVAPAAEVREEEIVPDVGFPVTEKPGNESFTLGVNTWDIGNAERAIADNPREMVTLDVADIPPLGGLVRVDKEYAMTTDLSKPIILAPVPGMEGNIIIDGYHRLYKAKKTGVKNIQAHVLTPEESQAAQESAGAAPRRTAGRTLAVGPVEVAAPLPPAPSVPAEPTPAAEGETASILERIRSEEGDGDAYFNEKTLEREREEWNSRGLLIHMNPEDFLLMAEHIEEPTEFKQKGVAKALSKGEKFTDVPRLTFKHDQKGVATVVNHEGRHRAMALRDLGVKSMPVVLWSTPVEGGQSIRWDRQDSKGFDLLEGLWPTVLKSETKGRGEIPFPVPDIRAEPTPAAVTPAAAAEGGTFYHAGRGDLKVGDLRKRALHVGTRQAATERVERPAEEGQDITMHTIEVHPKNPYMPEGKILDERDAVDRTELARLDRLDKFRQELIDQGYDVIPYINGIEGEGTLSYMILDPSAITVTEKSEAGRVSLGERKWEAAAVSMEPVSVPHQAVLDADRLQARRRGTPDLPGSRLSQNRNRLEREYSNPADLEDRIRQQLGVMEVSNPGITAAMEADNSQIDFDNKRLISNDGLTAVVWENTGSDVGTFTVEKYAHNESGVRGLFMENAGRMTSEEYDKAYADRDDLPTHRQVVETLVGMGLAEQVMPAARRGYDDIQFTPSQASGFPLPGDVLFGKISGIVKGGVNWGKEVVKKVRTWGPHFRTRGRFTPPQYDLKERYDGELAREFNNLKTRIDDFHNAVVETYGDIPLRNLPKETRDLLFRALSDPKLRDDLSPSVAEALGEMRDYEQILSIIMRHSDYVTDDLELTFDENFDVYLNRTFRGHDDPGWADEVRENRPELIAAAEESVQRGNVEKWERVIRKSLERAVKRLARNKPDDTTRLVIADDALSTEFLDKVRAAQKWKPEKDAFEKMIAEEISSNEKLLKDVKEGRLKTEKGIRNRAIAEAKKKVSMERLGRVKEAIWLDLHREIPIDQIIEDNTVKMTPEQLRGRVEKYLTDLTVIAEQRRGQQPEKGKVNPSILMRRTLEDEAFRELYGEYKDIDLVFARTTIKMATFIARNNFHNDMLRLGLKEGFIKKEKDHVDTPYQMEGREWGALEGKWTNLEFQRALQDAFGPGVEYPGWMKLWAKGVGIAKANKTIVSPQTTERNLWGNSGFSFMWGHGGALGTAKNWMQAWSVGFYHAQPSLYKKKGVGLRGGPKVPTGWIGMRPKKSEVRKFINEALEEGILNQSLINEATELISEAWDMDFNDYDVTNQEGRKKLVAKVKRALGKSYKGAGAVYEMMDNVPKLAGYLSEKSLYEKAYPDWTTKQIRHKAADNIKNQYPTWSRVPRFMKELRRFLPMGTFVTFHSELFRTSYRGMILAHEEFHSGNPVLRRRAIGVMVRASAITAGISALAGMIASVWYGIDDEERELLDRHQPPWSRYSTNFYYREDDGTIASYDLSFMFPHLALGDAWNAITDPEPMGFRERAWGAAWQLLEPFAAEDMVMQGVYDVKRNKRASGGEVWNPEDTPRNIFTAASDHLWKKFEPGFITSGRRLSRAWSGYSEQSGRVYDRTGEIISFLAGVRSNAVDMEGSLRYKSWTFRDRKRNANKLTTRHGYSMKTGSSEDFRKALEQTERQLQDIYSQLHQDLQAGIKLELLTEGESYRILKLNNISDADARLVLANRHVSHRLSNDQLRKIYKTTEGEKKLEYYRKWQQGLRE